MEKVDLIKELIKFKNEEIDLNFIFHFIEAYSLENNNTKQNVSDLYLWSLLPNEQKDKVFNQPMCDIGREFLGFTDIYEKLSEIIPKHFTVIDLGCAYNPQCFYFKDHLKYVAVDISDCIKFKSDNCEIFQMTIEDFIKKHLTDFDLNETFAICSYVPPWGTDNIKLVRFSFKNLFTYYPHGGYNIRVFQ